MRFRLVQILLVATFVSSTVFGAPQGTKTPHDSLPFVIKIGTIHDAIPGHHGHFSITKGSGDEPIRAFDFLIDYDTTKMQFISGSIGAALSDNGSQWSHFACTRELADTCTGQCPSGLLRITAVADSAGGDSSPSCYSIKDGGELAKLRFILAGSEDDGFLPVRFVWRDCLDNTLYPVRDKKPLVANRVLDWDCSEVYPNYCTELTSRGNNLRYSYGGIPSLCNRKGKASGSRPEVTFRNGGVDYICCSGGPEPPGDLNLNGIAMEINDGALLTKYLLEGLPTMSDSLRKMVDSVADINADAMPLTIADLVYLQKIIIGDASPYAKLRTYGDTVAVRFAEDILSTTSSAQIAGIYAVFECDTNYAVEALCDLPLETYYDSAANELRVLQTCIIGRTDTVSGSICHELRLMAGENELLAVRGPAELKWAELSDYAGNLLTPRYGDQRPPPSFALASAVDSLKDDHVRIDLYLPFITDWRVDISNGRQQILKTWTGKDVGHKSFNWLWADFLPGEYTVRASAGPFAARRRLFKR